MTEFYIDHFQLRASDGELIVNIMNDIMYVSNLVNKCSDWTGITAHPLPVDTWDEQFIASFFIELEDPGDDDRIRIQAVFEKAFEIGNLESRFRIIEGGAPHDASNN